MNGPEVSVIIPVYNRAATIGAALRSALDQEGPALEVVLVDDGSTDALAAALAPFRADPRLTVLRHPARRGAAAARNTAIAAARGAWLAFLDSDDAWRPGKLAAQLAALDEAGPDVRMVLTASLLDRGAAGTEVRMPRTDPTCRDAVLRGCTQCPGSAAMVARAAFLEHGPFDETLDRLEDWDWLLRYTRRDRFVVVPEPLAVVNIHAFEGVSTVDRSVSTIWRRHAADVRREGLRRWRLFASAVLVERAFSRIVTRRFAAAAPLLAAGLVLDAGDGELSARLRRRLGGNLALFSNIFVSSIPD